jgi:hypothetical protein
MKALVVPTCGFNEPHLGEEEQNEGFVGRESTRNMLFVKRSFSSLCCVVKSVVIN